MHFSIPDTSEVNESGGSSHTAFNIHINGVFHCSVRYRELHSFNEQLKKEFLKSNLPEFPPKKLLSLSLVQLEERRGQLERYIQFVSQNPAISSSTLFNTFLLQAQQRSQKEKPENVTLDAYLMNGHKISVNIVSTDQTDDVLETVAAQINLPDDYVYYFALFLVKKEEGADNAIVRKLQEFESPYISLKSANKTIPHRIVVRKNFWDSEIEQELMDDRIAMNLLYVQAVSDLGRGWVLGGKDQHKQLRALQDKNSKRQYLELARGLRYYGHLQFHPCVCDYPNDNTRVIVYAGNRELTFTLRVPKGGVTEHVFKVTRMRCWRITSSYSDSTADTTSQYSSSSNNVNHSNSPTPFKLELSFEYLVAKDTLQWVTITSEQAILMSMCLQGMVDELIMKKNAAKRKRPQDRKNSKRRPQSSTNGSAARPLVQRQSSQESKKKNGAVQKSPVKSTGSNPMFKRSLSTASGMPVENEVFEREDGIGDDDL